LYSFSRYGRAKEVFRAKTPPEEAVGMVGSEVGALFRIRPPDEGWLELENQAQVELTSEDASHPFG